MLLPGATLDREQQCRSICPMGDFYVSAIVNKLFHVTVLWKSP
jgi:hypothetical protein